METGAALLALSFINPYAKGAVAYRFPMILHQHALLHKAEHFFFLDPSRIFHILRASAENVEKGLTLFHIRDKKEPPIESGALDALRQGVKPVRKPKDPFSPS